METKIKIEMHPEVVKFFDKFGGKAVFKSGRKYITPSPIAYLRDPYDCTWEAVDLHDEDSQTKELEILTKFDEEYEQDS